MAENHTTTARMPYSHDSSPTSSTSLPPVNDPRSGKRDEEPRSALGSALALGPRFSLGSSLLVAPRSSLGSLEEVVSLSGPRRVCPAQDSRPRVTSPCVSPRPSGTGSQLPARVKHRHRRSLRPQDSSGRTTIPRWGGWHPVFA